MNAVAIDSRNALDIDTASIRPAQELRTSNDSIDNTAELNRIYGEQGYLLFRGVLDKASINRALRRMMDVMARHGIVAPGAAEPIWTGVALADKYEESPEFSGICKELVENPANLAVFEKIMGERVSSVPIVQYRSYPPFTPLSVVHQDGFYAQGIQGYRPVWIPLMTITPDIGGLVLAAGQHRRGYLHNLAKPPIFPIPADAIPPDAWATTTFHPGDVLVIHPQTPHVGLANQSDRVRFSIDTRVQSAANPCVLLGDVAVTQPDSIVLRTADGDRTLTVGEETYIRTGENRGARVPFDQFQDATPVGLRVVAAIRGDELLMLRRASEG